VRCAPPANKPLPSERDNCAAWLRAELSLLAQARVVVCLGAFAWEAGFRQLAPALRPRPRFGHGAEAQAGALTLLGCFHPSQQNTFTGKLTPPMIDAVLERARALADQGRSASSASRQ
jgi:uracil-DNA glycosylase family 4